MIELREIKKFLLRILNRADGPLADGILDQAAKDGLSDRPLQSDIDRAKQELETAGMILGADDELIGRTWALTTKGTLKAKQLG